MLVAPGDGLGHLGGIGGQRHGVGAAGDIAALGGVVQYSRVLPGSTALSPSRIRSSRSAAVGDAVVTPPMLRPAPGRQGVA